VLARQGLPVGEINSLLASFAGRLWIERDRSLYPRGPA
jgi:hypothetical protein